MQGGGKRNPAKNRQIAAAWMELSLLQEQGGYAAVAGKRDARHSEVRIRLHYAISGCVRTADIPAG